MVEPGCSDKHAARLQLGPLIFAKLAAYSPLLRAWGADVASHTVAAPLAAAGRSASRQRAASKTADPIEELRRMSVRPKSAT